MSSVEDISEDDSSEEFEPTKKPSKKPVNKTGGDKKTEKGQKPNSPKKARESIERVYQKKTQKEHILLRPDTYIGSVEKITQVFLLFLSMLLIFYFYLTI